MWVIVECCAVVCEQKCHVTEQEVHNALLSGDQQDQLVIAYHLVLDNNRIADEADKLQIHDFFVASSPPVESFMLVGSHCYIDVVCGVHCCHTANDGLASPCR